MNMAFLKIFSRSGSSGQETLRNLPLFRRSGGLKPAQRGIDRIFGIGYPVLSKRISLRKEGMPR